MIRGTTPTLRFKIPYTEEQIQLGYLTFSRGGNVFLDIPLTDERISIENYYIYLTLSQEDTLRFNSRAVYSIQIRLLLEDDIAVASNIMTIPISAILKNGTI